MVAIHVANARPMTRLAQLVGLLLTVAVVAALACLATLRWASGHAPLHDMHERIHQQLGLSRAQEQALVPVEQRFEGRKRALEGALKAANGELARAISEDKQDSPRVRASVGKIHEAMGQLQVATLEHVFEMKAALTPTQYDRLIELTARALSETDDGR
jgi:Spy/CpxP family protein refolding chaperone